MSTVKLKCPRCGAEWSEESFEVLMEKVAEMWTPWLKDLTPDMVAQLVRYNDPERLRRILKEEGQLKMFCLKCRIETTLALISQGTPGGYTP